MIVAVPRTTVRSDNQKTFIVRNVRWLTRPGPLRR
jgi:hypothetical protein